MLFSYSKSVKLTSSKNVQQNYQSLINQIMSETAANMHRNDKPYIVANRAHSNKTKVLNSC